MIRRVFVVACTAVLAFGVTPVTAHETVEVGDVELVAGWADEPTYVGVRNAVQLVVRDGNGDPIEGLAETLGVEVWLGDQTTGPLELRAVFGSPGEYHADLIPTVPGAYTFHFTGEVNGTEIDQELSPPGFDEVRSATGIQFPAEAPSSVELAQAIERLEGELAAAGDGDAGRAELLSIIAVVLGGIALILALLAVTRRKAAA